MPVSSCFISVWDRLAEQPDSELTFGYLQSNTLCQPRQDIFPKKKAPRSGRFLIRLTASYTVLHTVSRSCSRSNPEPFRDR